MKNITILFIVGILISSSIGAIGTQLKQETTQSFLSHISTPSIEKQSVNNEGYLLIELNGISTFQTSAGQPQLPKIVRILNFLLERPISVCHSHLVLLPPSISLARYALLNKWCLSLRSPKVWLLHRHPKMQRSMR